MKSKFRAAGVSGTIPALILDEEGRVVAKVYGDEKKNEPINRAALLALAPDLLDQLKALIVATQGPMVRLKEEIDRAEALILKIEAEK